MELQSEISIPSTSLKQPSFLFTRSYTVFSIQLYEVHCTIQTFPEIVSQKRYSELRRLFEKVKENQIVLLARRENIILPTFPGKNIIKNREGLVERRRNKIEIWLKAAISHQSLIGNVLSFLGFEGSIDKNYSKSSLSQDEIQVFKFVEEISSNSHNKMMLIENFNWIFFAKKRTIQENSIKKLVECLIPLCGNEFYGSKVLDTISKLTTSDYFRDFSLVCTVFTSFPSESLKKMYLNEYLTKKRFADSQLQAYNLCKIIEETAQKLQFFEILNRDQAALTIFENWRSETLQQPASTLSNNFHDWRPLIQEKFLSFSFRFIGHELELNGEIIVETCVSRVMDILLIPCERKKWDLRLVEMKPLPGVEGFVFKYLSDRTFYEFHAVVSKTCGNGSAKIEFQTTCYDFKESNTILGKFHSTYSIELIEEKPSSTMESEEKMLLSPGDGENFGKVKVCWNSRFCEASYSLVRGDLFQEANTLRHSFELFVAAAENRRQLPPSRHIENPLISALARKQLGFNPAIHK